MQRSKVVVFSLWTYKDTKADAKNFVQFLSLFLQSLTILIGRYLLMDKVIIKYFCHLVLWLYYLCFICCFFVDSHEVCYSLFLIKLFSCWTGRETFINSVLVVLQQKQWKLWSWQNVTDFTSILLSSGMWDSLPSGLVLTYRQNT